jgi:hypothetical protein
MIVEIVFKILVTLILIIVIVWIWTHHIDVKETILGLFEKVVQKMIEWIATRDKNAIFQNGKIVGNVTAKVDETEDKLIFHEICNTSKLNQELPFEYRREKLMIVEIGSIIGQENIVTSSGSEIKYNIIRNVVCEKVK